MTHHMETQQELKMEIARLRRSVAQYEEPGWTNAVQKVIELQARVAELEELLGEDAGAAWFNLKARVAELEEALREIARGGYDETTCQMFAVAALAHKEENGN